MCVKGMREAEEFTFCSLYIFMAKVLKALSRCTVPFLFKCEEKLRHKEVNLTRSKSRELTTKKGKMFFLEQFGAPFFSCEFSPNAGS